MRLPKVAALTTAFRALLDSACIRISLVTTAMSANGTHTVPVRLPRTRFQVVRLARLARLKLRRFSR